MFWLDNFNELFKPILYPNINMSLDEKINAVVRLILFIGIITTLVFNDSRYILFVFIIMIISIIIYNYQSEKNSKFEKFLNSNDLDIINNEICTKPTKDNKFKSCSIENERVMNSINSNFEENIFRETDDIYNKSSLDRNFYTMPSTTIPSEREKYTDWLYERGASCKENNGEQCYNNLYNNIKNAAHY